MPLHLLIALLLTACTVSPSHADKVIGIADGDTLTILKNSQPLKVRLANIDAPEKAQAFGNRSRQALSDLCFGKSARLEVQTTDRYGRTVAVVHCDGVNANRSQVSRGMAWVYPKYNKDPGLPELELRARAEQAGLWTDRNPMPPWTWRKSKTAAGR